MIFNKQLAQSGFIFEKIAKTCKLYLDPANRDPPIAAQGQSALLYQGPSLF
jgi:hypothetical protein